MRSSTERSFFKHYWAWILTLWVVSPLLGPCASWSILGCSVLVRWWVERRTYPRYIDFVLAPLRPDQLPRNTYFMFNRWTPEFMALGCGLVGDFRLAYQPRPVFVRYFLPPDRRVKGEVSDWDEQFVPGFTTVFDDGRLLESVRFPKHHSQSAETSKLWYYCDPDVSIADLYAIHQRRIDLYESTYGAQPLTVAPDRLLDIAQYGHRLVWWERNELPARYGIPQVPAECLSESATAAGRLNSLATPSGSSGR